MPNIRQKLSLYFLLIIFVVLAGLLASCSKDLDFSTARFPQEWKLVKMTGSWTLNPPTTGADMEWQESYTFYSDFTFVKRRERNGTHSISTGTFTEKVRYDTDFLELTHESENPIIENCVGPPIELLSFENGHLISAAQACDGPGLEYERIR